MTIHHHRITIAVKPVDYGPQSPRERERAAVSAILSTLAPELALAHLPSGAPVLVGSPDAPGISISHGGGMAAVAIGPHDHAFGIDIEAPRPKLLRVARKFLSPDEMSLAGSDLIAHLRYWTAKEAVYKAALTPGLPLTDIAVNLAGSTAAACGITYSLIRHDIDPGLLLCLAVAETV